LDSTSWNEINNNNNNLGAKATKRDASHGDYHGYISRTDIVILFDVQKKVAKLSLNMISPST